MEKDIEQKSLLQDGIHSVGSWIWGEEDASKKSSTRAEVERYAGEFAKTVPLFMPIAGKAFTVATYGAAALLQGLDQVKSGDKAETQALDFGLGLAKGALTKGSFDLLGRANFSRANVLSEIGLMPKALAGAPVELTAKAFSFGISSRLIDTTLTKETYHDRTGNFSFWDAAKNVVGSTVSPGMLATDVAVFAGSPVLLKGVSVLARGALERSVVLQTAATGGSFGLLSGSLAEAQRQYNANESFDGVSILGRGLLQGTVTAAAAIPGGFKARSIGTTDSTKATAPMATDTQANTLIPIISTPLHTVNGTTKSALRISVNTNGLDALESAQTYPDPSNLLRTGKYRAVAEATPREPGASKYETENGIPFWQMADGRIFFERHLRGEDHVWAPYGSSQHSLRVTAFDGKRPSASILDESLGVYRQTNGTPDSGYVLPQAFDSVPQKFKQLKITDETLDKLTIVHAPFEPDWKAGLRVLPDRTGSNYTPAVLEFRNRDPETKGSFHSLSVDARIYKILSEQQTRTMLESAANVQSGTRSAAEHQNLLTELGKTAKDVVVTESYARSLDALRESRKIGTLDPLVFPELRDRILEARREIFVSPYRDQLLPEHVGQYIERLPDANLPKQILLLEHPTEVYTQEHFSADVHFRSAQVRFFKDTATVTGEFDSVLNHEWSHLAHEKYPSLMRLYTAAREIEQFVARKYGEKNNNEHWTVNYGELFLHPSADPFVRLATEAPIKTTILAEALTRSLADGGNQMAPEHRQALENRLQFVNEQILPIAKTQLENAMSFGNADRSLASLALARELKTSEPQLFEKLVNPSFLAKTIDGAKTEMQHPHMIRKLAQLDALRHFDPDAFAARENKFLQTKRLLSAQNAVALRTPKQQEEAAKLLGALRQHNPELFDATVKLSDLHYAAARDKASFDLLRQMNDSKNFSAIIRIAASKGKMAPEAVTEVMSTTSIYRFRDVVDSLHDRITPSDMRRFSPEAVRSLVEAIDKNVSGKSLNANDRFVTLMKANLLERIVQADPARFPGSYEPELQQRVAQFQEQSRQLFAQDLEPGWTAGDRRDTVNTLTTLAFSADPKMLDLARDLFPREMLENFIRSNDDHSGLAITAYGRLYPAYREGLVVEMMESHPAIRSELVPKALWTFDMERLRLVQEHINEVAPNLEIHDRLQALAQAEAAIKSGLSQKTNDATSIERLRIRMSIAQRLLEPLPMSLFPDVHERFDALLSTPLPTP